MILTFILASSVSLLFLFMLLLISIEKKDLAHYLLIVIFSVVCCFFLLFLADIEGVDWLYSLCFILSNSIGFLLGPLFLLFVESILTRKEKKHARFVHFLPSIVHWAFITLPLGIDSYFISDLPFYFDWISRNEILLSGLESSYLLGYILYCAHLLRPYVNQGEPSISLRWSRQLLVMAMYVTIVDIAIIAYELLFGELAWYTGYVTIFTSFSAIFYLAYMAFQNGFATTLAYQILDGKGVHNSFIFSKQFSPDEANAIKTNLDLQLLENKIYQNPNLSLGQLASKLNMSQKNLSLFINRELNTNFYELINEHRIEDAKQKLNSDTYSNYSIMGIASDAGFKSKTSFYRLFKRATNLSPAEYQKKKNC